MTIGVDDIDQDILKTYLDQYNDDPTQFSWSKVFDAVKSMGGAAAKFATSGPGIAGLGGAALGLLDRAPPSGGGTTMAYPGAMDLSRTMVQGKYGPIAEYKSPYFTGTADYRDFKSPTFPGLVGGQAPAAAPAAPGRSIASKIAQYKELAGYGLSDERIRRIAEVMYGPQTDSDWAELTRLAGGAAKGIKAESAKTSTTTETTGTTKTTGTTGTTGAKVSGTAAEQFAKIGKVMPANWETTTDPFERIRILNSMGVNSDQLKSLGYSPTDISWMESRGLGKTSTKSGTDSNINDTITRMVKERFPNYNPNKMTMDYDDADAYRDELLRTMGGGGDRATKDDAEQALAGGASKFQVTQGSTPQAKANEYNRLRANMSDAEVRALADTAFGKQTDADWSYLKQLAGAGTSTPAGAQAQGIASLAKDIDSPKAAADQWQKNVTNPNLQPVDSKLASVWRDPITGKGIGVEFSPRLGVVSGFSYFDEQGNRLKGNAFDAAQLYKDAEQFGIDLSGIGSLGASLDAQGIRYKPYELYAGTGSDHGIDFNDIARGGLGTAYDWTKDPNAALKGPTAASGLQQNQDLYQRLGIETNPDVTTGQGIDPGTFTSLTGKNENDLRSNVVYTGGTASWYGTPQQAETFAGTIPGAQVMDVSSKLPAAQINPNNIQTQVAQPRNLMSLLPQDWGSITDPQKKIAWFNQQKATDAELLSGGVGQGDIDWMRQHGFGKYAHGGAVQMEDGGFVMTKRAVDGAGGPQGIQQLVPGARMIRGPGTGTSDEIPAVINGRNGQTPARLSNGEAYVPPGRNTKGLYALMHQLERKA